MRKLVKWFKGRQIIEVVTVDHVAGTIKFREPSWQVKPMFAWYDCWVGVFVDREKRKVYVFPIPCVGLVIYWG